MDSLFLPIFFSILGSMVCAAGICVFRVTLKNARFHQDTLRQEAEQREAAYIRNQTEKRKALAEEEEIERMRALAKQDEQHNIC